MSNENTPAVQKCAELVRLEVTPAEEQRLSEDFARILDAFRGLTELDVERVEPMLGAAELASRLRKDVRRESLSNEALLAPAPKTDGEFFSVPKTVDSGS